MALAGVTIQTTEAHERSAAHFGIDTRHPFGDRRIAEFAFALPEDQRWRGGLTKFVLRTAAKPWVPAMIRDRTTYGTASGVISQVIRRLTASGLWENSVAARRGWIDVRGVTDAIGRMTALERAGDDRYESLVHRLWLACAAEVWATHVLEGHYA
jgi:hypothetical protein